MDYVSKGVLKSKMLEYFRQIEASGQEIIITDNNVPVLKVVPLKKKRHPSEVFAKYRGKIKYKGDLTESMVDEWKGA